ncbi:MAG: zinc ribbon domain-containing protein [Promethearchaeota archaeon]
MNYEHTHKQKGEAPHDNMVGALIALTVVSIVMNGLFNHIWFSVIPQIVLLIHLIKSVAQYFRDVEKRRNFVYKTEIDELIGIWVANIIVSIIMSVLFNNVWFAQIAPAVLRIKAVEITILYFVTLSQANRQKKAVTATVYIQPRAYVEVEATIQSTPAEMAYSAPIRVVATQAPQVHQEVENRYCHTCGEQVETGMSFCAYCGERLFS